MDPETPEQPEVDLIFVLGGSASGKTYAVENTFIGQRNDYSELYALDGGDFREALTTYTIAIEKYGTETYEKLFKKENTKKNLRPILLQKINTK